MAKPIVDQIDFQEIDLAKYLSIEATCDCVSQMANILSLAIKGEDLKELEKYVYRWGEVVGIPCPIVEHMYRVLLIQMAFHE